MKERCNKRTSLSDSEPNFKFIIIFKCAIEEFNKQMCYNCFNGLIWLYLNQHLKLYMTEAKLKINGKMKFLFFIWYKGIMKEKKNVVLT